MGLKSRIEKLEGRLGPGNGRGFVLRTREDYEAAQEALNFVDGVEEIFRSRIPPNNGRRTYSELVRQGVIIETTAFRRLRRSIYDVFRIQRNRP